MTTNREHWLRGLADGCTVRICGYTRVLTDASAVSVWIGTSRIRRTDGLVTSGPFKGSSIEDPTTARRVQGGGA